MHHAKDFTCMVSFTPAAEAELDVVIASPGSWLGVRESQGEAGPCLGSRRWVGTQAQTPGRRAHRAPTALHADLSVFP